MILDCVNWARDRGNKRRVEYYAIAAALAAKGEAVGGANQPTTLEHTFRSEYADKVLAGTANMLQYALAVSTNATIRSDIESTGDTSDGNIEYAVNSMFSKMAGYDEG